jgi:gliding motility-associated-like protein
MNKLYTVSFTVRSAFIIICLLLQTNLRAQINITPGGAPATIISNLVGAGLTVSNVALNCPVNAYGTFSNGLTTNIGISNGIILTTGSATNVIGPNNSASMGTCNGTSGSDPQLSVIEPLATEDLCVLEFDIVPQCNQLTIRFVFGSEEYPEFVNSSFNDAFGFFITGPGPACQSGFYNNTNVATLPNNTTPVSIDNVNATTNSAYYVNNTAGATIQYDGFTTVLVRTINLCPCQTYHFKLAIADAGDCIYDSGVLVDFLSCSSVLSAAPTSTPSTSCTTCNGTAAVNLSGGVGPFTYSWAPSGGTGATASGLCPGTYTVTVNDGLTCTPSQTFAVTVTGLSSTVTTSSTQTNVLCNGGSTGSATVTASGGTSPYTFSWSPAVANSTSGNSNTATGLAAGTYVCTVTDLNGCIGTHTITITQPPALTSTFTQVNVLCNGGNTGSTSVTASGGTPGYTFSWSPAVANSTSGSTNTATSLSAGTYVCTITDLNGCTTTRTVTITQPPALTNTFTQVNVLCNGANTGSATVTASGGTPGYTFSWSPAVTNTTSGSSNTATGLGAGTYVCTITDLNGCTSTRTVTITQPPALTSSSTQVNVLCNGGNTGSTTVTASGGTPGYTFSWSPAVTNTTSGSSNTATGLGAGTYVCTITDLNGCTTTRTVTITQPTAISLTPSSTASTCGNNNGSVSVTATGGAGGYTYLWTPGSYTTATVNSLGAGSYNVTVTDANGCTATTTATINNSSSIAATNTVTNVLCNGASTGSATVTVTGNNGVVTYVWSPNVSSSNTASSLAAGTYIVTATDAMGCVATTTVVITQPTAISSTSTQVNVLCNGGNNGSATVTASGGTPGYTFSWSPAVTNTSSGNSNTATGLSAGTYVCTITDLNGCTSTRTITITQPPALTNTFTQVNVLCNGGNTGSATVTASGGTPGYTFSWSPAVANTTSGSSNTATGLSAGTYVCTITDLNGCTSTRTVTITQPPVLTHSYTQVNVLCNGGNTGSATVTASGGTPGYTFSWSPAAANTTSGSSNTATGLSAGTYVCTITDLNGCTSTLTVTITQPPALTNTFTQVNVLCNGGNTGSATVTASGGTPGYTFSWSPAATNTTSGNSNTATGLSAGTYVCTITDLNGCISTRTITITQPPALTSSSTQVNLLCNGGNTGSATVTAGGGTPGYTFSWSPAAANTTSGNSNTATGLSAGSYVCTITDLNGCTQNHTVTITQPPAITLAPSAVASTCGNSNGSVSVTASGGTGGYTYLWTPGNYTTATVSNLGAGSYNVTVTDANGCTATASVAVNNSSTIAASNTVTNVLCNGASTGSATVTVTGNNGVVNYVWSPNVSSSNTASSLAAGTYIVTATDAMGCVATTTVVITQPPALAATWSQVDVLCNAATTGTATLNASGGTPGYTFGWSPAVTSSSATNSSTATALAAGTYVATVTDLNGCALSHTFTITQPTALALAATQSNVLCNGGNTGSTTVTASGATPGYSFAWQPGVGSTNSATASTATGLSAGTYICTATDLNGCTASQTVTITQPAALSVSITTSPSTCGNSNGSVTASASGGTGSPAFSWNTPGNDTTATVNGVGQGSYVVTVTDDNNCTATGIATVNNLGGPTLALSNSTPVLCFGDSSGTATVSASGGNGNLSYNWSTGDTTVAVNNLPAGTFTVIVSDANNCTDTVTLTIAQPPALTATWQAADVLCNGGNSGTVTLTASAGSPGYSFGWTPAVGAVNSGNTSSATGLAAGQYICAVTDTNGCVFTDTVTINQPAALTLALTPADASCAGGSNGSISAVAGGGAPGYQYNWLPAGGNAAVASGLTAGTYYCTVTDTNGCVITDSAVVAEPAQLAVQMQSTPTYCSQSLGSVNAIGSGGTGNINYLWQPGNLQQQSASQLPSGWYWVTLTDQNNCQLTDSVQVQNQPGITVAQGGTTDASCFGYTDGAASVTVTGGTPTYTYSWSPNVSSTNSAANIAAGQYIVTVTDSAGCAGTVTVTVIQPSPLGVTASASSPSICVGQSITLNANGSGGTPAYTYAWLPIMQAVQQPSDIPAASTTYTVIITDLNGCVDSTTTSVTVNALPAVSFVADTTSGCAPLCVDFSDLTTVSSPSTVTQWQWYFGDGDSSATASPTHCYNLPGQYDVTLVATTSAGCSALLTMPGYIQTFGSPVAAFGATPQPATMINPTILFSDSSVGAVSWNWNFGDLINSSSVLQNPSFTYPAADCYQVTLTVTSADGCTDMATDTVCIAPDATLFVPNAFTPDGDGDNDYFYPQGIGFDPAQFEMWIFDRWGNMIFFTDNPAAGWDGRANNGSEVAQIDTYVWKIKCVDVLGKKHNLIGKVTLIK